MSKETFYFSHDYNTRTDIKIKKLMTIYGWQGYGLFWAIIEDLYNNANALPMDYDGIAYDLRTTPEIVKSIINDFGFFEVKDGIFGSLSIQGRIEKREEKSNKARDSANKRWNKDANALPTQSESNAIKDNKVKESKVKDNIITPSEEEFLNHSKSLLKEKYQSLEFALKAKFQSWVENGWKDGNDKKIKNWKTKIANTIPFLKPMQQNNNSYPSPAYAKPI